VQRPHPHPRRLQRRVVAASIQSTMPSQFEGKKEVPRRPKQMEEAPSPIVHGANSSRRIRTILRETRDCPRGLPLSNDAVQRMEAKQRAVLWRPEAVSEAKVPWSAATGQKDSRRGCAIAFALLRHRPRDEAAAEKDAMQWLMQQRTSIHLTETAASHREPAVCMGVAPAALVQPPSDPAL
jgi:hypothetical protein